MQMTSFSSKMMKLHNIDEYQITQADIASGV